MVTGDQGLNLNEQESHVALWSVISAPLILGNDPQNMSEFEKKLILNSEIISINQDPSGQGTLYKDEDQIQIWKKHLSNGDVAILFINLDVDKSRRVNYNLSEFKPKVKIKAWDVINKKNIRLKQNHFVRILEPHACGFIVLTEKR